MTDVPIDFRRLIERGSAPGIAIAWSCGDRPIESRVSGLACVGTSREVTADTCFPWFSATKLFTATAALQLNEGGKIALDQPLAESLEDLRIGEAERVTPRQLLAHTAGLANPLPLKWVHLATETAPDLESMTVRLLARHGRLRFEPGTRYAYSNLGYLLLGVLIQRAGGIGFEEYIEQRILQPLGSTRAGFVLARDSACGYVRRWSAMGLVARLVLDRRFIGSIHGRFTELNPFQVDGSPYGGLIGPATDLVRLGRAMLNAGNGITDAVITGSIARLALAPALTADGARLPIGLGWHLGASRGEQFANHVGGGIGFRSELRIYPRRKIAIAVIANQTTFDTTAVSGIEAGVLARA